MSPLDISPGPKALSSQALQSDTRLSVMMGTGKYIPWILPYHIFARHKHMTRSGWRTLKDSNRVLDRKADCEDREEDVDVFDCRKRDDADERLGKGDTRAYKFRKMPWVGSAPSTYLCRAKASLPYNTAWLGKR
jgi:hypothetical protein